MSLLNVLTVIFVTLKLLAIGAVANWSWWLVFLPFYGGYAIFFGSALFAGIVMTLTGGSTKNFRRNFR